MKPSSTLVDQRARQMVEAMERAQHWIYAVPPDAFDDVRKILESKALRAPGGGAEATVFSVEGATISCRPDEDLGVCWLVAIGAAGVPAMAEVLKETGFFAHTELLHTAHDPEDPGTLDAALTLVYMAMEWDTQWSSLVNRHWEGASAEDRERILVAIAALIERCPAAEAARSLRDALQPT